MDSTLAHEPTRKYSTTGRNAPTGEPVPAPAVPISPAAPLEPAPAAPPKNSIMGLVRDLTQETRTLMQQEIKLAKAEISEKLQHFTRNGIALAIGGTVAYAGLIVLLLGLGFLAAWAIHLAGIQGMFASFLGLLFIGLVTIAAGGAFILKGLGELRKQSLAPERTMQTLQDLKGTKAKTKTEAPNRLPPEPSPSSEEMQTRVEATEAEMGQTLDELTYRLDPRRLNAKVKSRIQEKPLKAGLIALGAGLLSGIMLKGRSRHA